MMWRRRIENLLLGALSLAHVAVCRVGFGRGRRAKSMDDRSPILVIRCEAKLGDNLLHIPFLRALRSIAPGRPIHLVHHVAARGIYEDCPYVDERIEVAWRMSAPATLLHRIGLCAAVFRAETRGRYDIALVPRWDEDLYAPFIAWMSGAQRIVGFSRRVLAEKAVRNIGTDGLFTDAVRDTSVLHESRRSLQLLERLSGTPCTASSRLEFWFPDRARSKIERLQSAVSGATDWVAIAPGAALDRRKWPLERFRAVAQVLAQRAGLRVLVIGTAAESDACAAVARDLPGLALDLSGHLDLQETAAALSTCRLFIGNDSGLLHLACAVQTPVLEISCHPEGAPDLHPNSPARFGPSVEPSAVMRPSRALAGECRDGCVHAHAHCITGVATAGVIEAAAALLGLIASRQDRSRRTESRATASAASRP
jgi:heptosyltransferase-2